MDELELLKRKLEREKTARKQAESILETKALELYAANESLRKLNDNLEAQILERTRALQESELNFRTVIDHASDIIYTTDENGNFTYINAIGSRAFGFSSDEILNKHFEEFVVDEYKEQVYEYYIKLKEENTTSDYFEFPIRSKSGKLHWIGQNVNRIEKADGKFSFNAVARDISLRKIAERNLEKARVALTFNEAKYRSVLENMDLGLMEVDINGKITRAYDKFCNLTGYEESELIGKDASKTFIVEGFEHVLEEQDQNRLNRQSGVYEVQIKHKNGSHIWVLISGTPFYDENEEVIGSLGVHYDITDRKNLEDNLRIARERAINAQKAEQQFLANMSHEIRTPLNAIIGMAHLLQDTKLEEKQIDYVQILSDSAGLLKGLVSDILDISKIDSGMAEMTESDFILVELIDTLINTFSLRSEEKGMLLNAVVEVDLDLVVRSDRQWINQILINLISNAIKFTSEGEVNLLVKNIQVEGDLHTIYFEVNDTGIGIDEEEIKGIFNSFKQANNNVRKNYGGTGLGLYISSKLVSLLGGDLKVESKEGKGSRFFFTLQIKSSIGTEGIPSSQFEIGPDGFNGYKILIVEDNKMNQKYISSLCEKWGIDYDIAENGLFAIEKFKSKTYDLIFMDLSMPVMDGYEATRLIRSIDKKNIPIIALTASTFLSKKQLALQSGMTDFLAKPFVPQDLLQMLRRHLKIRKKPKALVSGTFEFSNQLNSETLNSLYEDDYSYALDMFVTYQEIVGDELELFIEQVKNLDRKGIISQAHKMKPIFTMVGLNRISAFCEMIENNLENLDDSELQEKSKEIVEAINDGMPVILKEIYRLEEQVKIKK